jgi:hypothetical protein
VEDLDQETADAQRVLVEHLAAMNETAEAIEDILCSWLRQVSRTQIDHAIAADPHRTRSLAGVGTLEQVRAEEDQITAEFPGRVHAALERSAWRHLWIDPFHPGSARILADVDYGIWQHSGYKIPPAYEGIVTALLGRISQLLRKYGYRPEFGRMVSDHRHPAPPEAIPVMEQYYRLSMRLPEILAAVESARMKAKNGGAETTARSLRNHTWS